VDGVEGEDVVAGEAVAAAAEDRPWPGKSKRTPSRRMKTLQRMRKTTTSLMTMSKRTAALESRRD
jgi:hypothetical protein